MICWCHCCAQEYACPELVMASCLCLVAFRLTDSLQAGACTMALVDEAAGQTITLAWRMASAAVSSEADSLSLEAGVQQLTITQALPDRSQQLLLSAGPSQASSGLSHAADSSLLTVMPAWPVCRLASCS